MKGEISTTLRPKEGRSENSPKAVGSGRWSDCRLLTAAVLPELILARPGIPVSAGVPGPPQRHVGPAQQGPISTTSHTALVTCKERT